MRAVRALRDRDQVHTILLTVALGNLHTLVEPTFQGTQYQMLFFWVVGGALAYSAAAEHAAEADLAGRSPGASAAPIVSWPAAPVQSIDVAGGRSAST